VFDPLRTGQQALGLGGALLASIATAVQGAGAAYMDLVTMSVAPLLAVRWWQMRALARAGTRFGPRRRRT
jgi:hypothetical protein